MAMNDPLGDMIARIYNAQMRNKSKVSTPASRLRVSVLDVLKTEGFISKPGRRVYASVRALPRVNNGLGVAILSTPKGVMADHDARDNNVGGEILCTVF